MSSQNAEKTPNLKDKVDISFSNAIEASVPKFLIKLYQILETDHAATEHIICWSPDGNHFLIKNPTDFAEEILPVYFRHNNFSSFVRQLHKYSFKKSSGAEKGQYIYSHPFFKRGQRSFLTKIERKKRFKPAPPSISTESSVPELQSMISENSILKRVHTLLRTEIDDQSSQLLAIEKENEQIAKQLETLNKEGSELMGLFEEKFVNGQTRKIREREIDPGFREVLTYVNGDDDHNPKVQDWMNTAHTLAGYENPQMHHIYADARPPVFAQYIDHTLNFGPTGDVFHMNPKDRQKIEFGANNNMLGQLKRLSQINGQPTTAFIQ